MPATGLCWQRAPGEPRQSAFPPWRPRSSWMSITHEDAHPALPPELLNNDPQGFAWGVWHDRTPKLVTQIRDSQPYGPSQRRALEVLLKEIASGVMEPLGPHAHDQEIWASWGADYFGKPWLDAPFLWS